VDGFGSIGVFDKMTGGEADSESVKYSEGGMGPETSQGGRQTTGNVTITRQYKRDRDHALARQLAQIRGRRRMSIHRQPLDPDGNAFGDPWVYTGFLKTVTPGDVDSESSDPDLFEIEQDTDSTIG
jgi:hypothetical protein